MSMDCIDWNFWTFPSCKFIYCLCSLGSCIPRLPAHLQPQWQTRFRVGTAEPQLFHFLKLFLTPDLFPLLQKYVLNFPLDCVSRSSPPSILPLSLSSHSCLLPSQATLASSDWEESISAAAPLSFSFSPFTCLSSEIIQWSDHAFCHFWDEKLTWNYCLTFTSPILWINLKFPKYNLTFFATVNDVKGATNRMCPECAHIWKAAWHPVYFFSIFGRYWQSTYYSFRFSSVKEPIHGCAVVISCVPV